MVKYWNEDSFEKKGGKAQQIKGIGGVVFFWLGLSILVLPGLISCMSACRIIHHPMYNRSWFFGGVMVFSISIYLLYID